MPAGAPLGNDNGRRGKALTDALKRALARAGDGDIAAGANKVAQVALDAALGGEQWAVKEVWDRMEGKPAQALTIANEDGEEFRVLARIERVIVDPKD